MVDIKGFNDANSSVVLNYGDFKALNPTEYSADNNSIFANTSSENVDVLNQRLDDVKDKQGCFSNTWNSFKELTGVGTSVEKCDEAIEKYSNGEITFEEASAEIDKFASKQESSLNLFSNIATSIAAIGTVAAVSAVVVASGGTALPLIAAIGIGAGAGAATKVAFKTTDRATNEIEGDALDAKEMGKDALSGAVTGGLAAYSMGTAGCATKAAEEAAKEGVKLSSKECAKIAMKKCGKIGIATGAVSGASNYAIDCAFDEDKDFNMKEFAENTFANAAAGGAVGVAMGGFNGMLRSTGVLHSGCDVEMAISGGATAKDVAANSVCTTEYKILNDRIRSVAS